MVSVVSKSERVLSRRSRWLGGVAASLLLVSGGVVAQDSESSNGTSGTSGGLRPYIGFSVGGGPLPEFDVPNRQYTPPRDIAPALIGTPMNPGLIGTRTNRGILRRGIDDLLAGNIGSDNVGVLREVASLVGIDLMGIDLTNTATTEFLTSLSNIDIAGIEGIEEPFVLTSMAPATFETETGFYLAFRAGVEDLGPLSSLLSGLRPEFVLAYARSEIEATIRPNYSLAIPAISVPALGIETDARTVSPACGRVALPLPCIAGRLEGTLDTIFAMWHLYAHPVRMVNAHSGSEINTRFIDPYVGVGVGLAAYFYDVDGRFGTRPVGREEDGVDLAVQATAGWNFRITDNFSVAPEYRYLFVDASFADPVSVHLFLANLRWTF